MSLHFFVAFFVDYFCCTFLTTNIYFFTIFCLSILYNQKTFQQKVYMELLNTTEGETITYGELARRIGCRSAQAIGQALKRNPFAPDVPCHRVIASNGTIGGYNGKRDGEAIERKRTLLEAEKRIKKIDHTQR